MKFLVITQDLRISGTSAGIVVRSFLAKFKKNFSNVRMDVLYISHFDYSKDDLKTLSTDNITAEIVNSKIPFHIKWINRFTSRFFDYLYADEYIHRKYAKHISKVDYQNYEHVFVFSSGVKHETILATYKLPILKRAIIIFHDPYPHAWYDVKSSKIHKNEFLRLKKMIGVVRQARACGATAFYMARDLQYLYASNKYFHTLPHFFEPGAFNLTNTNQVRKKKAKIQISYQGALMLGRNIFNVLEAYTHLIDQKPELRSNTEFVLRVKGDGIEELRQRYSHINNIIILHTLDFSNSYNEQVYESDINIILENGPHYSNTLPGKVPLMAATGKPFLIISPQRSEIRRILNVNDHAIVDMNSITEIKNKLESLLNLIAKGKEFESPFGNYFSDDAFKQGVNNLLKY